MTDTYCIYRIVNFQNGKCYVGLTCDFRRRKIEHSTELKRNDHSNPHLQNAYNKYGKACFYFEVLEDAIAEYQCLERETYWVAHFDSYRNGYNRTAGGDHRNDNFKACVWNGVEYPSIREGARAIGVKPTTLQRRLMKGYKCDEDFISHFKPVEYDGKQYRSISEAARANGMPFMAMWHRIQKGYQSEADLKDNRKPVTYNGVQYASIAEAARAYGIVPNSMRKRLKKLNGTHK